jgi:ABC-type phosphate transport system substrate-binding protein
MRVGLVRVTLMAACIAALQPAHATGVADTGLPSYEMQMPATGPLTGIGDPAMRPLLDLWFAAFRQRQPGVAKGVPWTFESDALAIGGLMFETADFAVLGRTFTPAETAPYAHQFAGDMMKAPLLVRVAGDLARPVYVALNKRPGSPLPRRISEFLDFALSLEGQQIVARQSPWTPLSAAQVQEERRKLEGFVAQIDLDLRPYVPVAGIGGTVRSVGSDGMKTLMDRWMRDFERVQPHVHKGERWEHLGTLNGFHALIGEQTDLAPMGRELWPEERVAYEQTQRHPVLEIRVARGGFDTPQRTTAQAIFVSDDNPLDHITVAQVAGVFAEPPTITRWGQLGLTGAWADRPVKIHMPPHVAPNAMWMQAEVLKGAPWRQGAVEAPIAETAQALAGDAEGIGFGGFEEGGPGLHALAVAADAQGLYIAGNPVSASNGKYPLTRYMYIRLNRRPGQALSPVLKQFLRYVLSREGQEPILYSGYFPLGARVVREELAKLE